MGGHDIQMHKVIFPENVAPCIWE